MSERLGPFLILCELQEPIQSRCLLEKYIEKSTEEKRQAKCIYDPIACGWLNSIVIFAWEGYKHNDYSYESRKKLALEKPEGVRVCRFMGGGHPFNRSGPVILQQRPLRPILKHDR